jgi:hypothetical protein
MQAVLLYHSLTLGHNHPLLWLLHYKLISPYAFNILEALSVTSRDLHLLQLL